MSDIEENEMLRAAVKLGVDQERERCARWALVAPQALGYDASAASVSRWTAEMINSGRTVDDLDLASARLKRRTK